MIKLIKENYKVFISSIIIWFLLIVFWNYLDSRHQVSTKYFGKLSQEFRLTTALGIITTIFSSFYNYQKTKTQQNQDEIRKNRDIFQNDKEIALAAIRRLEDLIDQQTFELRRLDDFGLTLSSIRSAQNSFEMEYKQTIKILEDRLHIFDIEIEKQKEQISHSNRVQKLIILLKDDIKDREVLKLQMLEILKRLEKSNKKENE